MFISITYGRLVSVYVILLKVAAPINCGEDSLHSHFTYEVTEAQRG